MKPASKTAKTCLDTSRARLSICQRCGGPNLQPPGEIVYPCECCLFDLALSDPEPPISTETGTTIGSWQAYGRAGAYELIEEIGRGGMGVIYKARKQGSAELVAVKMLLSTHGDSAEAFSRFARETRAVAALKHPNVMPIREICLEGDVPFFTMDLAVGGSLVDLLPKYRGRWRQAAELMVKVAQAVEHAHEQGILHRDLKPGNILFMEELEPAVSDFGLAKWLTEKEGLALTRSSVVFGTPSYVAPEQAAGKNKGLSAATDVYSLGAILYELLAGRPPFVGDSPLDVLQQVLVTHPPPLRSIAAAVPKDLEAICLRCLEKAPADRYPSALAFSDDLNRWLLGEGVAARKENFSRWCRKKRTAALTFVAFSAAALMGFAVARQRQVSRSGTPLEVRASGLCHLGLIVDDLSEGMPNPRFRKRFESAITDAFGERSVLLAASSLQSRNDPADIKLPLNPQEAARKAGLDAVVCVTLRENDGQVRVTSRIVQSTNGTIVSARVDSVPLDSDEAEFGVVLSRIKQHAVDRLNEVQRNPESSNQVTEAENLRARANELYNHRTEIELYNAVSLYKKALELAPRNVEAQAGLAKAANSLYYSWNREKKWLDLSRAAAQRALEIDPLSSAAHQAMGNTFYSQGRYIEASSEYLSALETDPRSAATNAYLGMCKREMGQPRTGLRWMLRAAALDPARGIFTGILGETYMLLGEDQRAEETLKRYLAFDPETADAQSSLAILHLWQKHWAEAKEESRRIATRFPDFQFSKELAAEVAFFSGDCPEAMTLYEELAATSTYPKTWVYFGAVNPASALACMLQAEGSYADAESKITDALQMDESILSEYSKNSRVLHDLAAVWTLKGDCNRAMDYLDQAVAAGWVEHRSTMIDPRFRLLEADPRFQRLMQRTSPISESQ